jgi:hypothetical protein
LCPDPSEIADINFGLNMRQAYSASLAPEVNDESVPDDAIIDAKIADLYGLGTCLYAILTLDR